MIKSVFYVSYRVPDVKTNSPLSLSSSLCVRVCEGSHIVLNQAYKSLENGQESVHCWQRQLGLGDCQASGAECRREWHVWRYVSDFGYLLPRLLFNQCEHVGLRGDGRGAQADRDYQRGPRKCQVLAGGQIARQCRRRSRAARCRPRCWFVCVRHSAPVHFTPRRTDEGQH